MKTSNNRILHCIRYCGIFDKLSLYLMANVVTLICSITVQSSAQTLNVITKTGTTQIKTTDIDSATVQSTTFTVVKKDKTSQIFTLTDIQRLAFTNLTSVQKNQFSPSVKPYPNPSYAGIVIEYELTQSSPVEFRIVDAVGDLIKIITIELQQPGIHQVVWDATNQNSMSVSSGVYTCFVRTVSGTLTKKLIIVH